MKIRIIRSNLFHTLQNTTKGKIFFLFYFMSQHMNKIGNNIFDDILVADSFLILNDGFESQSIRLDEFSRNHFIKHIQSSFSFYLILLKLLFEHPYELIFFFMLPFQFKVDEISQLFKFLLVLYEGASF